MQTAISKESIDSKNKSKENNSPADFKPATPSEINDTVSLADSAFQSYKDTSAEVRISFLKEVISELEKDKATIVNTAQAESHLTSTRLENEFNRTVNQITLFIAVLKEGSWLNASIDRKKDANQNIVVDIRKINVPLGPVVVFGASNFPLAFSVAGGDTVSALASGCPVIVKAHNGHPKTSKLVADAILRAVAKCHLPQGVFSIVYGQGSTVGTALVKHALVKAVGFTGSFSGGKALLDVANARKEPIPVYAEMGSLNPVLLLPAALNERGDTLANQFAGSITMGCGQFCTKPGVFFAIEGEGLDKFISGLRNALAKINAQPMLSDNIHKTFKTNIENKIQNKPVVDFYPSPAATDEQLMSSSIATVSAKKFMEHESLQDEFFGPFALIVKCKNEGELKSAISILGGQLTATLIGNESELNKYKNIIETLIGKAGRVLYEGVPTGVDVGYSMHHGGPFPSSSSALFTSVGADAIKRFVRPQCFQTWPESLLPAELQNKNHRNIVRRINGIHSTDSVIL